MVKWVLIVLGALAAIVAVAWLVGARLPRDHVAEVRAHFRQPPDSIFRVLTDVTAYPGWRTDVKRVERLPDRDGHIVWRETARSGALEFEASEAVPPTRLVTTIVATGAGFAGRWVYQLVPDSAGGTTLTIREEGSVDHPLFRFLMRYLFGVHATLETFLRALGTRFGEAVVTERLT